MNKFLPHPVAYRLVWGMKGDHLNKLYVWKPVPPSERFVAVGTVCTTEKQVWKHAFTPAPNVVLCNNAVTPEHIHLNGSFLRSQFLPQKSSSHPTPQEPPVNEVRCFPIDWCVKGAPQFLWEETGLGEPVKVWAGNGFGSCHFQTVGHPLDVMEPRPGKWYAGEEPAEDEPEATKQEEQFEIMAARLLSHESRDSTTYFVIDVTSTFGESWKVYQRYNSFFELRARSKALGHETSCHFPSKTLLRVSGEALEERRKALDWYMTELVDKAKQPWGGVLRPLLTEFLQVQQVS